MLSISAPPWLVPPWLVPPLISGYINRDVNQVTAVLGQ